MAMLAVLTVVLASGSQITIVAALLAAVYVGYWLATPRPWSVWLALLSAPLALAAIARSETGQVTDLLWVCPAQAIGFAISGVRAVAALVVLVAAAIASFLARPGQHNLHGLWQVALPMTLAFLAATAVRQLLATNHELALARQQLAVAAVQEERTRFARDLHDVLGHSLTVLVAKLRLARRLPADEAVIEVGDAEHLALGLLDEVRQAVEGYRGPTLDSQIAGTRAALGAAGIDFDVSGSASPLAAESEHALALSVREAGDQRSAPQRRVALLAGGRSRRGDGVDRSQRPRARRERRGRLGPARPPRACRPSRWERELGITVWRRLPHQGDGAG